jgi:hypothetical protein
MANTVNTNSGSNTTVGYYIANNNVSLFINPQAIGFTVTGMRPNTRLSVFFDKINVTRWSAPASVPASITTPTSADYYATGAQNDAIITDANGTARGLIFIPRGAFVVGNKEVAFLNYLANDENYNDRLGNYTCLSRGTFFSFSHSLVTATQTPVFSPRPTSSTSSGATSNRGSGTPTSQDPNNPRFDPMCQSFYVGADMTRGQDGIFLKSVDLYFSSKSNTQPVSIDIRAMENGIPTTTVLPFSEVTVQASSVAVSDTAATATSFYFDTPVYVRSGYEYAISVIPGGQSPDYSVWTASVGKTDPVNGAVNTNWGQGVLFTSSTGSTWTPIQNEYLKFNVYRADFANFASGGQATMVNEDYEFLSVTNISNSEFQIGEYVYQHPNPLPGYVSVNTTSNTLTVNTTASGALAANLAANFVVNDHICVIGSIVNTRDWRLLFGNSVTLKVTSVSASGANIQFAYANGAAATGAPFANGVAYFFKLSPGQVNINKGSRNVVGTGTRFDLLNNTQPIIALSSNNTVSAHNILFPLAATNSTSMTLKNAPLTTNSTAYPITAPVGRVVGIDTNRNLLILDKSTANSSSGVGAWANGYTSPSYFATGRTIVGTSSTAAAVITGVNDISINSAQPHFYQIAVQGSDVTYDANTITAGYSQVAYPRLPISETVFFSNNHIILASKSNEITNYGGEKSLKIYANLISNSSLTTPLLDLQHMSMITKENIISDYSSGEETNDGSALSKSITKLITLSDGLDAEDLTVYLTAYKPEGTNIEVYAKLLNASDPGNFEDKLWSRLTQSSDFSTVSDSSNQQDYKEFEYTIPTDPVTYDNPTDIITTNNSVTITSTTGNSEWLAAYSNNQLITVYSDANKTNYEIHMIQSVGSNTSITLATSIGFANTSSAFIGTMPFPYSAFKNSTNSNIVRYHDTNGVPYDSYKQYAIKIVLTAIQNNLVPKVQDMRAIALSV